MARKIESLIIAFLLVSSVSHAQQYVTSNNYVEADVSNDGQGLVSIFYAPKGSHTTSITHASQTSYLTVAVNGKYYTNNQHLPLSGFATPSPNFPAGYLEAGKTVYKGINSDTIETVWQPEGANKFDVIQDVYTVPFPISSAGQVVFKFRIQNHTNQPLVAQAQYLVDVDLGTSGHGNDAAPITTRFGYLNNQVTSYTSANSVPPYFIATLQPLDSANFPLLLAEGYMNDSLSPEPMGLMEPSLFAYVSWEDVVQSWTWGFPNSPNINDEALLFQWPTNEVSSGIVETIGSFSYGSVSCEPICFGNLDGMMVHPDHITRSGPILTPNHFTVDAIVWNRTTQDATFARGTQSVTNAANGLTGSAVEIISPQPTTNGGYTQTSDFLNGLASKSASSITWEDTVLASVMTQCTADSSYNIAFSVSASGVGDTSCQNGTYVCPILIDCMSPTPFSPVTTVLARTGSYDGSECNARCTDVVAFDTGTIRIPVLSVIADSLNNMRLTIAPNQVGADSTYYSVCVVDSMQNGTAKITVTDSLGNSTIEQYSYCTIADTHAPKVRLGFVYDTCSCFNIVVTDTQAWDRGLNSIAFYDTAGLIIDTITPNGFNVLGLHQISIFGHLNIPIGQHTPVCINAIDLAGNRSDSCLFFLGMGSGVSSSLSTSFSISISPNPTSADVSIFIEGAPSADVEIFDVLGREVDRFSMVGSYDWQTGGLSAGTYIVRVVVRGQEDSRTITKRIVKE